MHRLLSTVERILKIMQFIYTKEASNLILLMLCNIWCLWTLPDSESFHSVPTVSLLSALSELTSALLALKILAIQSMGLRPVASASAGSLLDKWNHPDLLNKICILTRFSGDLQAH